MGVAKDIVTDCVVGFCYSKGVTVGDSIGVVAGCGETVVMAAVWCEAMRSVGW